MSHWPRAVIFDFDGVIVNSEPLHCLAFQQVFRAEGIELGEAEYYRELIGFDDRGAIRHLLELRGRGRPLDEQTQLRIAAAKKRRMEELIEEGNFQALPGASEFITALAARYPLAICSGALRHEIESMLAAVHLEKCFRLIVAAEDVTIGKPDPSGYLLTTRLLAESTGQPIRPQDCLIVEDAPIVAKSVASVGFKVLAVATSYPIEELTAATWRVKTLNPAEVSAQIPGLL